MAVLSGARLGPYEIVAPLGQGGMGEVYKARDTRSACGPCGARQCGARASGGGAPRDGDRKPFMFLKTSFDERRGHLSSDGRWVAYMSNESGRYEIYVRLFSGPGRPPSAKFPSRQPGGQWQVSTVGGIEPRWSPDGKELYYIAPDARLMAAPITVKGATLEPGTPVPLFQTRIYGGGADPTIGTQYDVARDGRFLVNVGIDDATASPVTVVLNWTPELKK